MRVVFWGTYDLGKPRVRILLQGLKQNGVEVIECHSDVWKGIEDKSQIAGWKKKIKLFYGWLLSYPSLIIRYLKLSKHDVVIVGYLGHLDVLILWPFAKIKNVPIIWDAFLSLYNTVVDDRKIIGKKHLIARLIYIWEYLSCRAADVVLLDTKAHAQYFVKKFKIKDSKTSSVMVGAEKEIFPVDSNDKISTQKKSLTVLFYGQFIPLHGIETIILSAQEMSGEPVNWVVIGRGQEEPKIREMLNKYPLERLNWIPWVPYQELTDWINKADVCLGIFGNTKKASYVIPNKVFQILSTGKRLITRDSPAIRELIDADIPGIFLVPPENPHLLSDTLKNILSDPNYKKWVKNNLYSEIQKRITQESIGENILTIINENIMKMPYSINSGSP